MVCIVYRAPSTDSSLVIVGSLMSLHSVITSFYPALVDGCLESSTSRNSRLGLADNLISTSSAVLPIKGYQTIFPIRMRRSRLTLERLPHICRVMEMETQSFLVIRSP